MWTVQCLEALSRVLETGMLTCPFYGKRCLMWPHQHRITGRILPKRFICVPMGVEVKGELGSLLQLVSALLSLRQGLSLNLQLLGAVRLAGQ